MNPIFGIANRARSALSACRKRVPLALVLAGLATAASAQHDPPVDSGAAIVGLPFLISQHVIAGGGVSHAASPCFDLTGTIGQPVAGRTQGGAFTLDAGFWTNSVSTDSIFRNSFEACQP
jgi:hypothetical protein